MRVVKGRALGDLRRDRNGAGHEEVGDDLDLSSGRLACQAYHLGGQGHGFLPDLQISE